MRPINVTLDSQSWELAKQKTNFSAWVRYQLRLEADAWVRRQLVKEINQNQKDKDDAWLIGKCDCGVLKNRLPPSWCTNHEVHEVAE